jgi:hypothetical protein
LFFSFVSIAKIRGASRSEARPQLYSSSSVKSTLVSPGLSSFEPLKRH